MNDYGYLVKIITRVNILNLFKLVESKVAKVLIYEF